MGQRAWDGARLACAALVLALQLPTYRGASLEWSVWDNGQAEPEPAPPSWSADPEEIEGPERRGLMGAETVITGEHTIESNPVVAQPGWLAVMSTTMTPAKMEILMDDDGINGNLFLTGSFKNCMVVGDNRNLTSQGSLDMFFAKITVTGTWLTWFSLGGTWAEAAFGLAVDKQHMYITMQAGSKINNMTIYSSFGAWDLPPQPSSRVDLPGPGLVIKFQHTKSDNLQTGALANVQSGSETFARGSSVKWISASSTATVPKSITEDVDGGVIVTGTVTSGGNSTFGQGPGAKEVNFGDCSTTGYCTYIEKISATGTVMWAESLAKSPAYGRETKFTHINMLYQNPRDPTYYNPLEPQYVLVVGAYAKGSTFYDNTTDDSSRVNNYGDIFVAKFTNTGTMVYKHSSTSVNGGVTAYDASVNVNGDVFIVGVQSGSSAFGTSVQLYVEGTYEAAFVAKFDPSGNGTFLSAFHVLSSIYDSYAVSVAADLAANTVILGHWTGNATFGKPKGRSGGLVLRSEGLSDVFVVKINNIGTMLWVGDMVQGKGENKGATIVSDLFGVSMYLAGSFRKQTTFGYDPRLALPSAPAGNLPDAYLMEFKDPMSPGASMAFLCRSIQSKEHENHQYTGEGDAHLAVDGVPDTRYAGGSCSMTGPMINPWWSVDLYEELEIAYVKIYNSDYTSLGGNFQGKEGRFEIRIGNVPPVQGDMNSPLKNSICQSGLVLNAADVGLYRCRPTATGGIHTGRYLTIRGSAGALLDAVVSLCEVEVFVGPKYVGCSTVSGVAGASYRVHGDANISLSGAIQVDSYSDWNATKDSPVELCDKVCRMPKYFAVPPTLTADTAATAKCACNVAAPTAAEAAIAEGSCTTTNRIYMHQSRANFQIRAPPAPNPNPPLPYPPPSPPPLPSPPSPPPNPSPPPRPPLIDPYIVRALVISSVVLLVCFVIIPTWYRIRTRGLEDPFWTKRGRSHNVNDPDQEIDPSTITTNPSWRGKVWNGLTYGGSVYNPMNAQEIQEEVERAADITPVGLGQTSSSLVRLPSTRV